MLSTKQIYNAYAYVNIKYLADIVYIKAHTLNVDSKVKILLGYYLI